MVFFPMDRLASSRWLQVPGLQIGILACALAMLFLDAGCEGSQDHRGDDDDSASQGGDDDDSSAGSETLLDAEECDRLCSEREQAIAAGSDACPFDWNSGICREVCADYSAFATPTEEAFVGCVLEDPLCFQDIHDCVVWNRYPEPIPVVLNVTGSGFGTYEGVPLVIALDIDGANFHYALPQAVTGGTFSASWNETLFVGSDQLVLYYLDVDGNGDCDPAQDFTGSVQVLLGPDIDNPVFGGEELGTDGPADFVCDFI